MQFLSPFSICTHSPQIQKPSFLTSSSSDIHEIPRSMTQSIPRNTERESSEKAKLHLPCFDSNSSSNKKSSSSSSRKQNMMSLSQSCFSSKDGLSIPWPHNQTTFTKMLENDAYVHPTSNSFLSAKSLEMCTESLGSESGSCIDQFHVITAEISERQISCVKPRASVKKVVSFPPPLSSIGGVRVRTHREGGRLVMEASTLSASRCCFVAERGEGRLRLSLPSHGGGGDDGGEIYVKEGAAAGCGKVGCVFGGSGIRCNGNGGSRKRVQSLHLQFCVAGIS